MFDFGRFQIYKHYHSFNADQLKVAENGYLPIRRGQIATLANWASSKFVKSKASFTFQSLYSIFTLVLWSKILRFPLFEINGDTRISSTSGTRRGLFWLSLLPGELLVAGEVTNEPTRPERLSRIKDFGLWGSGESRLQKKCSKIVKEWCKN